MKFAFAALIATASSIMVTEPWDKSSLPACPDAPRTIMDDGETHVTKYPVVGATCQLQIGDVSLVMLEGAPAKGKGKGPAVDPVAKIGADVKNLEHCPDFIERHTLLNGATRAVAYPAKGYNCNADYAL